MFVRCDEIKKGRTYYLTFDFWPNGGKPVRLRRMFPAKDEWPGTRGNGAILVGDDGMIFVLHPKAVVFAEPPPTKKNQA